MAPPRNETDFMIHVKQLVKNDAHREFIAPDLNTHHSESLIQVKGKHRSSSSVQQAVTYAFC
ncbi:hypothetical protein PAXY110619_30850 [Paenibacillus xylanexedens]|uniref:Uncharacterized protein n=1 Tax=Paenibacillus xylanexedens TaxID=528191 RepID=A0ABS4RSH3_PAEXY|nr:hypothetical protein [Paenibacillus xylanexedens]